MSEPLIEKLRAQRNNGLAGALCGVAADRIVALEADNLVLATGKADLRAMLTSSEAERDALRQILQSFVDLMTPSAHVGTLNSAYKPLYADARAFLSKTGPAPAKPSPSVSLPGWAKGETP